MSGENTYQNDGDANSLGYVGCLNKANVSHGGGGGGSSTGKLTIIFISGGNSENVSFPGDMNDWNLNTHTLSINSNSSRTIEVSNAITSANIAKGSDNSKFELKLVSNSSWDNQWGFSSWTKNNVTVTDSDRQINISCSSGQDVTLTINVSTTTLTAVVQ